ncbi:uncharacterized protein LOC117181982 [Belonocnema kinseyi]|uniref:uncharacterized protein LOC117181982 n=1 Tax=Belonocnema kinseyi TaxID=2817044 RepID=UPI00143D805F|nr:uncharacterized protein LOC117181982 [Belonocnema kinseyi]
MPFLDIFRNLFGIRYPDGPNPNYGPEIPRQENNKFRNPIWENDDDEDDASDFRESNGGIHFQIFGDPIEMTRYFESQMDNMLKSIFDGFGQRGGFMVPFDGEPTLEALPPPETKRSASLRDRILNREFESTEFSRNPKVDSDLDGKISSEELTKVWKDPSIQEVEPYNPRNSIASRFAGRSTSTQIIRRSDGTLEKRQTFRDSDGNEKITVTRQIGDKMHEIITKKDKAGIESKTENLINMDEKNIIELYGVL